MGRNQDSDSHFGAEDKRSLGMERISGTLSTETLADRDAVCEAKQIVFREAFGSLFETIVRRNDSKRNTTTLTK
jgi:hypothetical protein